MTEYSDLTPSLLAAISCLLPAYIFMRWMTDGDEKTEEPTPADLDLNGPDWRQTMWDNSCNQPSRRRPFVFRRIFPRFFK